MLCFRASHEVARRLKSSWAPLGRNCFQIHFCGYWQDLVPCGLLAGVSCSPLSCGPLLRQLPTWPMAHSFRDLKRGLSFDHTVSATIAITSAVFNSLKSSHLFPLTLKRCTLEIRSVGATEAAHHMRDIHLLPRSPRFSSHYHMS